MSRRILAVLLLVAMGRASSTLCAEAQHPPSPMIEGVARDVGAMVSAAPSSDLWPVTWGADGHLYTSRGDGGGTNSKGSVSMGFARIEGPPENYVGVNIKWGAMPRVRCPFRATARRAGLSL